MIKFFRKIRQQLLSKNKFTKYLIYAIGEIVLVVIGILIALQINNWNEHRKHTEVQVDLINSLIFDLKEKMQENINDREAGETFVNRADKALVALKTGSTVDTADVKKLLSNLGVETWYFTTSTPTYISIVNSDLWQQLPDSIAQAVQYIYDHKFSQVNLGFEKLTDNASDCRLNFLAPTGLMDENKTVHELNDIILQHREQVISRLTLFVSGVNRQNTFFKKASDAIQEVLPELQEYKGELLNQIK